MGTNAIGWAALALEGECGRPTRIVSCGVRVFSDGRNPKDGQSKATIRRLPRQQRRLRDRYLKRRRRFMEALIRHGLMPGEAAARKRLETIDPWTLRVRGLDEKLGLHEFGRALFHLQQRRGFRSNRRTDRVQQPESGKIGAAAAALTRRMQASGTRTVGEYLARPRTKNGVTDHAAAARHPVRVRLSGRGAGAAYDFFPTREMVEQEFLALWRAQREFHGGALTNAARDELRDILCFQRELRPQEAGTCTLDPSESRAPRALPSVQRLRVFRDINELRIHVPGEASRKLTPSERNVLADRALAVRWLTLEAARKLLELPPGTRIDLLSGARKRIDGDRTAAVLAGRKHWGRRWRTQPYPDRQRIVEALLGEQDEDKLRNWLVDRYGLSEERADAVIAARLPEGRSRLGRTAVGKVLAELERGVVSYDRAVRTAGYEPLASLEFDGTTLKKLPYYGQVLQHHVAFGSGNLRDPPEKRYGRLGNPTVHVALNQLRRLVNELIDRFGPPAEIVAELAQELPLSAAGRSRLALGRKRELAADDTRRNLLKRLGQVDSYGNRLRLRLWEELNPTDPLDRRCPYTGARIGLDRLCSREVDIGHILPFSRTLDDSVYNKTLCMREANRFKGRRSPHEAFADSPEGYDWEAISDRAARLAPNRGWRFGPGVMRRYENGERNSLDRHLVDERYTGRLVRHYLLHTGADVRIAPGRMTADLQWVWGLDAALVRMGRSGSPDSVKNRLDHRHHAIDAAVVALTDRGLLKRVAAHAGEAEKRFDKRLLAGLETPWPGFRDSVRESIRSIVVSHKPDHGTQGRLHNDTAYGVVEPPDEQGRSKVVHRVALAGMRPTQLRNVRDPFIRKRLASATAGLSGAAFTRELLAAGERLKPPVRRVRITETLRVIPTVVDEHGRTLKAHKGDSNYCYDIYRGEGGRWAGIVVSRFEANRKDFDPHARQLPDGMPLIMRLRVNDMIATGSGYERRVLRVVKLTAGQIALADHNEAGNLKKRDADRSDPFRYFHASLGRLQELGARAVHVTVSGRLFDPGPSASSDG